MGDKGQVSEIVGLILIGVILFGGVYNSHSALQDARYVVDEENKIIYDLQSCDKSEIGTNIVSKIKNHEEYIKNETYTWAQCSK